ncbi:hypothetical protein LCGC14_0017420 [marine sediment metagenome]|uniref:Calcineurin-like phosphoesterase domain-containing protein n=1 Tax=marine sediment metagenome TaxID=412755 RepID=A0A0F9Z2F3_9ZZZZ
MHKRSVTPLLVLAAALLAAPLACTQAPADPLKGATSQPPPVDLLEGATWSYSTDDGKTFSAEGPTVDPGEKVVIVAAAKFDVADPAPIAGLTLTTGLSPQVATDLSLNGKPFAPPLKEMTYREIPGVDPALLVSGPNVLTMTFGIMNGHDEARPLPPMTTTLIALKGENVAFQTGPALGYFDAEHFTVTCRTNVPIAVTLRARPIDAKGAAEILVASDKALMHRVKVKRAQGVDAYEFRLEAAFGKAVTTTDWLMAPRWSDVTDGTMRFAAAADSRTIPHQWRAVSLAIAAAKPQLLVFAGDMVTAGRSDWEWDEQYFGPAKEMLATVPTYAVIGNHEEEAPVYPELFYTPTPDGRGKNWSQQVGDVLLIGIVGHTSFAPGTDNHKWLERTLAESKAKFIFLFNHYPGWSSRGTTALNEQGVPRDKITHQSRTILMPLLEKYNATAYVAGHHHYYERSEPAAGVTSIITGGAGAPMSSRSQPDLTNNPHSKGVVSRLHFCLFEVSGDTCTMKVITPDGEVFDTRTWQAREVK